MTQKHLISSSRQKISDYCQKIFHLRPSKTIQLKLNAYPQIHKRLLSTIIENIIINIPISPQFRTLAFLQTKITFTGNQKISLILNNNISFCKNWKISSFPPCYCRKIQTSLGVTLDSSSHISCLGTATTSPDHKQVLHSNGNNISIPSPFAFQTQLLTSLLSFLRELSSFIFTTSKTKVKLPHKIPNYCHPIDNIYHLLHSLHIEEHIFLPLIQILKNQHQLYHPTLPNLSQVLFTKTHLQPHLIISSPDKNSGAIDLACKQIFWSHMKTHYWDNKHHFSCLSPPPSYFLHKFSAIHKSLQWYKIAPFRKSGSLPYVYIIRKFKDLTRIRGITSYYNHPLKKVLFFSASGFMTILKHINFSHSNLFSPKDYKHFVSKSFQDLQRIFGNETQYITWAADIKEMYDWLPQHTIIQAVKHLLFYLRHSTRRDWVSVHRRSSKLNHLGKSHNSQEFATISFETIFQISLFEITHAYFILDNHTFIQKIGIPIGAPGAPGYSTAFCIFNEKNFLDSIYDYSRAFRYFRYFDDMRAIVAYTPSDLSTKSLALALIHLLKSTCYHKSIKIIIEEHTNSSFPFLEGLVKIDNHSVSSIFKNKNFEPLLLSGKLKFLTAQDFFSFAGENHTALRIGTVTGRLSTMCGYSFSDADLISSFGQLLPQLIALHYPKRVLKCACYKMFNKTNSKIWLLLSEMTCHVFKTLKLK
jgi:hypothetical protein